MLAIARERERQRLAAGAASSPPPPGHMNHGSDSSDDEARPKVSGHPTHRNPAADAELRRKQDEQLAAFLKFPLFPEAVSTSSSSPSQSSSPPTAATSSMPSSSSSSSAIPSEKTASSFDTHAQLDKMYDSLKQFRVGDIPYCFYIPDFVDVKTEEAILARAKSAPPFRWTRLSARSLQMWGGQVMAEGLRAEPLPLWLQSVCQLVTDAGIVYPPMRHEFLYKDEDRRKPDQEECDEKSDARASAGSSTPSAATFSSAATGVEATASTAGTAAAASASELHVDPMKLIGGPNHVLLNQVG